MVAEVPEMEEDEDEDEVDNDDDESQDAQRAWQMQSPGNESQFSQMSGTTAITSASMMTSHSVEEVRNLDPIMVADCLQGLFNSSSRILNLLAPSDASVDTVES